MTARDRLLDAGWEDVVILENYSYDDALVGVTEDGRAVYVYEKMVEWLMNEEGWTLEESVDWIDYNTIRALPYMGANAPVIMYAVE